MRSIASLPCKIVSGNLMQHFYQEIMLSSGVFRRERASGFYPWGKVPLCSKAVFYVFVFDSIRNSATLHNLCPNKYPLNRFFSSPPTSFLKCHRWGFNVCLQMGWNGAILGGILGGRRGVGESFAGFLAQGSILRVKEWTNEQFFARKVAF